MDPIAKTLVLVHYSQILLQTLPQLVAMEILLLWEGRFLWLSDSEKENAELRYWQKATDYSL